jgi:transcription elongation factor Elf1
MTLPRTRPPGEKPAATWERYAHKKMPCDGNGQPRPLKRRPQSAQIHCPRCHGQVEKGQPVTVAAWRSTPKTTIHCHGCAERFQIHEADTTKTPYLKRLQEDARSTAEKKGVTESTPRNAPRVPQEAPAAQHKKSARALSSNPGRKKRA